jgi:hypothetical protein
MKELYSFTVDRIVEKEVPHTKKTKDGPVETTKKVKKTIKNKVVFRKPSVAQREDADFFYGQKFNEFINAGFLTKAMLAKKMGDMGGITSDSTRDTMSQIILDNIEASRTVEFFKGAKSLDEDQKKELNTAEKKYTDTRKTIYEFEMTMRDQFGQTADAKAEQKLIEWLVLNFSYYEEEVEGEGVAKELFPVFVGEDYDSKRNLLLILQEDEEDPSEANKLGLDHVNFSKCKNLYEKSFETLIRVASVWYNQLGSDQKSIQKSLDELFDDDLESNEQK